MPTREEAIAALTGPGQPHEIGLTEIRGRRQRVFVAAPRSLRSLFAEARCDLPFLCYEDETLSFEQAWAASCRLAQALWHGHGVRPGDRVAIAMRNYPEWCLAFMAATGLGAIAVGMNALWPAHEMAAALADCTPRVLLADGERLERLAEAGAPPGLSVIGVRAAGPGAVPYAEAVAGWPAEMPCPEPAPDDDALMFFTSGSTGRPKGALSTHRNVLTALLSWEVDAGATVSCGYAPAPDPDAPQAATLLAVPLFHVTASHAVFLMSFRARRRIVSMYKWDPARAAALIARERISSFVAPPAVTGDLVRVAREGGHDLSSLVMVGGGGAARAPEQVRAIASAFGGARPQTGWGMTETNAIGCGIAADDYVAHPESSGRASCVVDLRVVDAEGRALPAGERGELQIRGASVFRAYWNRPEATAASFDGEWFRTGDVATIDAEGYVTIVDRIKDLVIRGGENIGCGAVEAAILEHPDVLEACAYGVPDARLGEELAATVHAREPISAAALREFLAPRLARFEIPRYLDFSAEPLPRIASGKIDKRSIRAAATARLTQ